VNLVDPLRQPQRFVQQADALVRQSLAQPGSVDPFATIDAQMDASFAAVLAGVSAPQQEAPGAHSSGLQLANHGQSQAAMAEAGHPRVSAAMADPMAIASYGMTLPGTTLAPGVGGPLMTYGAYPTAITGLPDAMAVGSLGQQAALPVGGARASRPMGPELEPLISEMSGKYGVPDWLVRNVIRQESGGNAAATSPVGAQGLMQLMPGTARDLGVQDAYDPRQNVEGGVKYLSQMMRMFDGDLTKAVAAYNAGPGNVQKYGGVPPFAETQNYVKRILG